MKRTIRMNERELHRMVSESVRRVLDEGRYDGGYDAHGDVNDENKYIYSYDYIVDSVMNGNIEQARELYRRNVSDQFDFMDYLDELPSDLRASVVNALRGCR